MKLLSFKEFLNEAKLNEVKIPWKDFNKLSMSFIEKTMKSQGWTNDPKKIAYFGNNPKATRTSKAADSRHNDNWRNTEYKNLDSEYINDILKSSQWGAESGYPQLGYYRPFYDKDGNTWLIFCKIFIRGNQDGAINIDGMTFRIDDRKGWDKVKAALHPKRDSKTAQQIPLGKLSTSIPIGIEGTGWKSPTWDQDLADETGYGDSTETTTEMIKELKKRFPTSIKSWWNKLENRLKNIKDPSTVVESVNEGKKYEEVEWIAPTKTFDYFGTKTTIKKGEKGLLISYESDEQYLVDFQDMRFYAMDGHQVKKTGNSITESVNEGKSPVKMFTESDILKHPTYKKSSEMVQSISEDMEGNTFHHHFHIALPLSEMLEGDYKTFAEIGSFCGGSMCLMLQNKKGKSHISIDPFKAKPNQEKMFDNNTAKYISEGQTLEKFVGLSDDPKIIKESCAAIEKAGGADIFFIDGSHAKHMVERDFKNYEATVNPGGLIIFDDYMDKKESPGVKKAVDGMLDDGMFDNYNVIGTIKNEAKAFSNGGKSPINNEYIIQKKTKDI